MNRSTIILGMLLLAGCASPPSGVMVCGADLGAVGPARATANWALGPSPRELWVATGLNQRSRWPSVETGYRLDDVSFFEDIQYDDQYYYGRYGGYSRYAQTVRTAVLVR